MFFMFTTPCIPRGKISERQALGGVNIVSSQPGWQKQHYTRFALVLTKTPATGERRKRLTGRERREKFSDPRYPWARDINDGVVAVRHPWSQVRPYQASPKHEGTPETSRRVMPENASSRPASCRPTPWTAESRAPFPDPVFRSVRSFSSFGLHPTSPTFNLPADAYPPPTNEPSRLPGHPSRDPP